MSDSRHYVWWHQRGGQSRSGARGPQCVCEVFGGGCWNERQLWTALCTYHLSAVLSINRHVFVPSDTLLKWNETSRGDKDLLSLCESNLKVPLRRLSFCSLKFWRYGGRLGSDNGGDGDTDRSCQGLFPPSLMFLEEDNAEMKSVLWRFDSESSGSTYLRRASEGGGGSRGKESRSKKGYIVCVQVWKGALVDGKKKSVIERKEADKGGRVERGREGEGSLKGHHLACSKWQ